MTEKAQPERENPASEGKGTDTPACRRQRILNLLSLDLVLGQPIPWRLLLSVAVIPVLLIGLVVWLWPEVVGEQRGLQAANATFSYPELLANAEALEPLPSIKVQAGDAAEESLAVQRGCLLVQWSTLGRQGQLARQNDVLALVIPPDLQPGPDTLGSSDSESEPEEQAMAVADAYFAKSNMRAFFELGLWLEKSREAIELQKRQGLSSALQRSLRERPRLLRALVARPQWASAAWQEAVKALQGQPMPKGQAALQAYERALADLANSLQACEVVS
ncbi:MAG: hypothetical protein ACWA5X_09100 [bacterium]